MHGRCPGLEPSLSLRSRSSRWKKRPNWKPESISVRFSRTHTNAIPHKARRRSHSAHEDRRSARGISDVVNAVFGDARSRADVRPLRNSSVENRNASRQIAFSSAQNRHQSSGGYISHSGKTVRHGHHSKAGYSRGYLPSASVWAEALGGCGKTQ